MKEQYRIAAKRSLTPEIGQISVEAPLIAAKAKAGQFIILRVDEAGERIPLTISSAQDGKVTVVYQKVGGTTLALDQLQEGDCLHDFVGPLGTPTHVEGYRRVAVLGGGLGCAIALPVAKAMKEAGAQVDLIGGFRSKDIVILEEEMGRAATDLYICTDDGSYGYHGFVTGKLEELIASGVTTIADMYMHTPAIAETVLQAGISANLSCGGVRVTEHFEVLGWDMKPVGGLYAAGETVAGVHGAFYCGGNACGFAHTSGFMAGRYITGYKEA